MAKGKYSGFDGRKSSSYAWMVTVTVFVFVSLSLVGVWMVLSPSDAPKFQLSSTNSANEVKQGENDGSGDFSENVKNVDDKANAFQSESQSDAHDNQNEAGNYSEGTSGGVEITNKRILQRKVPIIARNYSEHRERLCPEKPPTCLVPLPEGRVWYNNVPHTKLAEYKVSQNWVKLTGEYLTFPGGGTQFKHGALHYIEFIQKSVPNIAWGKRTRVILDVGCGVASFGGYLFEKGVITMSLAPKDEHEAQVQFALERGIPAFSSVMGTKRLPFPSSVFDVVHCARCRVPWHIEGGKLLLELNRVLRPGGYFVWSATPVYQKLPEDVEIWKGLTAFSVLTSMKVVIRKDRLNGIGAAIYQKPTSNECYASRPKNEPPLCEESDDRDASW
ncbi:hypothetical protein ACFE04_004581 [Oxalis oulophora]